MRIHPMNPLGNLAFRPQPASLLGRSLVHPPAARRPSPRLAAAAAACVLAAIALIPAFCVNADAPLDLAARPETAHREPAWRHPQTYPRPSPDRVYAPPAPAAPRHHLPGNRPRGFVAS